MKIQVVGSGCPTCKALHNVVTETVKEMNLNYEVEYITGIDKLVEMGIMQSPALVVDGKPVFTGYTQDKKVIRGYLEKEE